MKILTPLIVAAVVGVAPGGPVRAQSPGPSGVGDSTLSLQLRAALPLTHAVVARGSEDGYILGAEMLGGSVGLQWRRFWVVEAGAAAVRVWTGGDGSAVPDLFARIGVTPVLSDHRDDRGAGWMTQFVALAGYRHMPRPLGFAGIDNGGTVADGVTASGGLEWSRFFTHSTALTLRLLAQLTVPVTDHRAAEQALYYGRGDMGNAVDLAFDVGVSF
jgi:hypothetical protein